jgi:DtxR family Mn-dependent transcriptional regulator
MESTNTDLSAKMSQYLVEIYRLSERGSEQSAFVSTSALAELLDVTAPAVNRMVDRLKDLHLLHHEPYQGIRLTESGKREALMKLRYHRIAEVFLVQVMKFSWDEVHEEAQRISSSMSEALADRMLEMTDYPTHCPHGEPIPSAQGIVEPMQDVLLVNAEAGAHLVITRVLTRERDRLNYMAALGLLPGAGLQLIHSAPFNGPLQLKLKDEYRIIGHNLAELIRVKPEDVTR